MANDQEREGTSTTAQFFPCCVIAKAVKKKGNLRHEDDICSTVNSNIILRRGNSPLATLPLTVSPPLEQMRGIIPTALLQYLGQLRAQKSCYRVTIPPSHRGTHSMMGVEGPPKKKRGEVKLRGYTLAYKIYINTEIKKGAPLLVPNIADRPIDRRKLGPGFRPNGTKIDRLFYDLAMAYSLYNPSTLSNPTQQ